MTVTGIIFANLHDAHVPELTAHRTMASVPFGCRYRFIDFALSNMVNAGITDVSVLTHYNYRSLMDHVGSGMDWDLSRRSGGLVIYPPYVTQAGEGHSLLKFENHLESLKSISDVIFRLTSDLVVFSDSDAIFNLNLQEVIDHHLKNNADITGCVKRMSITPADSSNYNFIESDSEGNITDIIAHPKNFCGEADVAINVWVIRRSYLQRVLSDALSRDYSSFKKDIVLKRMGKDIIKVYRYEGYYGIPYSLGDYFDVSMKMLDPENRKELFNVKNRPVYTKVRNSPPTIHVEGSKVTNSLIADGCIIEGEVENSILFRGVRVGKGAVVKNSILFQDTQISSDVSVNCVVADKNVVIRSGVQLSGHPTMPICIGKGRMI